MPYCRNNSKIKYQNRRKRQNRYPNTQIHDCSFSLLGKGTSIKSGEVKLVFIEHLLVKYNS